MEPHIIALTGLRGVAVLLVFFGHLQQRFFPYEALNGSFVTGAAYYGMTVFFVLSGFVIHWNYSALFAAQSLPIASWRFIVARFARLWPLHFAVTLVALVFFPDFFKFIQHALMIQTWVFQGTANISYFNTWSISTEWFFYFVYAAGYPVIARCIRSGSLLLLPVLASISFAAYWAAGPIIEPAFDRWLTYYSPFMRVLEFLTGVVAAQITMTRYSRGSRAMSDVALLAAALATFLLYRTTLGQLTMINYLGAPMVAVALMVSSNGRSLFSRAMSVNWLIWVGNRSYSIYLLEAVYLVFLGYNYQTNRAFTWDDFLSGLAGSLFGFVLVLAASHFCWRYFEMPARLVIRNVLDPDRAPARQP